jgi:hypothetical protein
MQQQSHGLTNVTTLKYTVSATRTIAYSLSLFLA